MKIPALLSLATAAGVMLPAAAIAQQPAPRPLAAAANPNQQLADAVAAKLRGTDLVAGANVQIVAQQGVVHLSGTVHDAAQKANLATAVRGMAGVSEVRVALNVPTGGVIQAQVQPAPVPPTPIPPIMDPVVEPAPVGLPGQIAPDMQAPPLPPYAWPTYAPYNNASRIAYPQAYPYNAFPFIGPYYPFPKVPLGWRKVTLEWSDGHWYLGRSSAPQDYWRVKFQ